MQHEYGVILNIANRSFVKAFISASDSGGEFSLQLTLPGIEFLISEMVENLYHPVKTAVYLLIMLMWTVERNQNIDQI